MPFDGHRPGVPRGSVEPRGREDRDDERVVELSNVQTGHGWRRRIVVRRAPGKSPAVDVETISPTRRAHFLVRAEDAESLLKACALARDPAIQGRHVTGEVKLPDGARFVIAVHRSRRSPPNVSFQLVSALGEPRGRPQFLFGAELDALVRAIDMIL